MSEATDGQVLLCSGKTYGGECCLLDGKRQV